MLAEVTEGYESDGSLNDGWQCKDEKEASCDGRSDNGNHSVGADQTLVDSELTCIDDGASTSRSWETSQSEGQSNPETQTEAASDQELPTPQES